VCAELLELAAPFVYDVFVLHDKFTHYASRDTALHGDLTELEARTNEPGDGQAID
jgi:hypothetical protein